VPVVDGDSLQKVYQKYGAGDKAPVNK